MKTKLNLGRGSKRHVRLIRWKRNELLSLLLLLLAISCLAVWVATWFEAHHIE